MDEFIAKCSDDCTHSAMEHVAFDRGRQDATDRKPSKPPHQWDWTLQEDYRVGYSAGFLDLPKDVRDQLNNV